MAGFKLDLKNETVISGRTKTAESTSSIELIERYVEYIEKHPAEFVQKVEGKCFAYINRINGQVEVYTKIIPEFGCVTEFHFLAPQTQAGRKRLSLNKEVMTYVRQFLKEREQK